MGGAACIAVCTILAIAALAFAAVFGLVATFLDITAATVLVYFYCQLRVAGRAGAHSGSRRLLSTLVFVCCTSVASGMQRGRGGSFLARQVGVLAGAAVGAALLGQGGGGRALGGGRSRSNSSGGGGKGHQHDAMGQDETADDSTNDDGGGGVARRMSDSGEESSDDEDQHSSRGVSTTSERPQGGGSGGEGRA